MKWFKHMTDMSNDVRIKRLIREHGISGYGLYNYILELIVRKLETESPIPDLEETASDIAADMNMDTLEVERIMLFCINQGLFQQDEITGRIVAKKIYKFIAQSETRSKEIREMCDKYKASQIVTDIPRQSETKVKNRTEEKRTEHTIKENTAVAVSEPDKKLYNEVKTHFEEAQPQHRFTNYPKEGKAIKGLIEKSRARDPDAPDVFLHGMIQTFRDLREREKFYKSQPYLPSALNSSGIWDRVLTEAHEKWKDEQEALRYDPVEVPL